MLKNVKKIYIIGPAGSGKTTKSNELGDKYNLPVLHLDDIFWEIKFTKEFSNQQKTNLLKTFLQQHNKTGWIIEGANDTFLDSLSTEANKIILLNKNSFLLIYRIIKRFLYNKINGKNQDTLRSTWRLIKGVVSYNLHNTLFKKHLQIYQQKNKKNR